MKKNDIFNTHLDKEEQEIADALDQNKPQSVDNLEEKIAVAKEAAANYLRKDARVNIRISSSDLNLLKKRAKLPKSVNFAFIQVKTFLVGRHPKTSERRARF